MRAVVIALCLVPTLCLAAQKGKGKAKATTEPVVEIDPWGRPRRGNGEELQIWQDESGWHIRAYAGKKRNAKFRGDIFIVDGKVSKLWGIQGLETKKKGNRDIGVVSGDRKSISFELKLNRGGEDGFEFSVTDTTKQLQVAMLVDGFDHPEKISIGAAGSQASGAKFLIPVAAR